MTKSIGFCFVDVFSDSVYSKIVIKCNIHGDVDPFIISQNIFVNGLTGYMSIKFIDLYNAVKNALNNENNQTVIKDRYDIYIVSQFDATDYIIDCGTQYSTLDIYEDSFHPFNVYYVNEENLIIDETNIFSDKLSIRKINEFIIANECAKSGKDIMLSDASHNIRATIYALCNKFKDHFKYMDYIICRKSITRLDQLKNIGFNL